MSRQNVEIARRAFEAAFRRPKPDFAAVNALFDPNHELIAQTSEVEGETFRGASGFRRYLASAEEVWDSWAPEIERVAEIDDDRVLLAVVFKGRSRRGGVPIEGRYATVATVHDGRVTRTETRPHGYRSP
jgi:ketosteroid isomerase-like protein